MGGGASLQTMQLLHDIEGTDDIAKALALIKIKSEISHGGQIALLLVNEYKVIPRLMKILESPASSIESKELTADILILLCNYEETKYTMKGYGSERYGSEREKSIGSIVAPIIEDSIRPSSYAEFPSKLFGKCCVICGELSYIPTINFMLLKKQLSSFLAYNPNVSENAHLAHMCEGFYGLSLLEVHRKSIADVQIGIVGCVVDLILAATGTLIYLRTEPDNTSSSTLAECSDSCFGIKVFGLGCLYNLSVDASMRLHLIRNVSGLLTCTVRSLQPFKSATIENWDKFAQYCEFGCGLMANIAFEKEALLSLTAPADNLLPSIGNILCNVRCNLYLYGISNSDAQNVVDNIKNASASVRGPNVSLLLSATGLLTRLSSLANARQYLTSPLTRILEGFSELLKEYLENLPWLCNLNGDDMFIVMYHNCMTNICQTLSNASLLPANYTMLTDSMLNRERDFDFIEISWKLLQFPMNIECKKYLCGFLNHLLLLKPKLAKVGLEFSVSEGILPGILQIFKENNPGNMESAAEFLCNISKAIRSSRTMIVSPDLGLVRPILEALLRLPITSSCFDMLCKLIWQLVSQDSKGTTVSLAPSHISLEAVQPTDGFGSTGGSVASSMSVEESGLDLFVLEEFCDDLIVLFVECFKVPSAASINSRIALGCLLTYMSLSAYCAESFTILENGLIRTITSLLRLDRSAELRACCSAAISNMSLWDHNKILFGDLQTEVVPALIVLILEDQDQARLNGCCALKLITMHKSNKRKLISPEIGLVAAVVKVLRRASGLTCENCCSIASNLASLVSNKVELGRTDVGLLKGLQDVLKREQGAVRIAGCIALSRLAKASPNKIRMMVPELQLFPVLVEMVNGNKSLEGYYACLTLCEISTHFPNKTIMMQAKLDLVKVLVEIIWEVPGNMCTVACKLLASLAESPDLRVPLLEEQYGMLEAFVYLMKVECEECSLEEERRQLVLQENENNDNVEKNDAIERLGEYMDSSSIISSLEGGTARVIDGDELDIDTDVDVDDFTPKYKASKVSIASATITSLGNSPEEVVGLRRDRIKSLLFICKALRSLSVPSENKCAFVKFSLELLRYIGLLLHFYAERSMAGYICFSLWNISVHPEAQLPMVNEQVGLLNPIVRAISIPNQNEKVYAYACGTILNLTLCEEAHEYLLDDKIGLIYALARIIDGTIASVDKFSELSLQAKEFACIAMCNLASVHRNRRVLTIDKYGLVRALSVSIKESYVVTRKLACQCVCNLAGSSANRSVLTKPEYNLLPPMAYLVKHPDDANSTPEILNLVCLSILYLAGNDHNRLLLTIPKLGILVGLGEIAAENRTIARFYAVSALRKLSENDYNRPLMVSGISRSTTTVITRITNYDGTISENKGKSITTNTSTNMVPALIKCVLMRTDENETESTSGLMITEGEEASANTTVVDSRTVKLREDATITLSNLAQHPPNLEVLIKPDIGVVQAMVSLLLECVHLSIDDDGDQPEVSSKCDDSSVLLLTCACNVLHCLAENQDNRIKMCDERLQLLNCFIAVLHAQHVDRGVKAFIACICRSLSRSPEVKAVFVANIQLIKELLNEVLMEEDVDNLREFALTTCMNVATLRDNRPLLLDSSLRLIDGILCACDKDRGGARVAACATLYYLVLDDSTIAMLFDNDTGVLDAIVKCLQSVSVNDRTRGKLEGVWSRDVRANCAAALSHIGAIKRYRVPLSSPELGIVKELVRGLNEEPENSKTATFIISFVGYLALADANLGYLGSRELGLVQAVCKAWEHHTGIIQEYCAGFFLSISRDPQIRLYLCQKDVGLLVLMLKFLEDKDLIPKIRNVICGIFWNLAIERRNKAIIGSPEYGLIPLLINLVYKDRQGCKRNALFALAELALSYDNKPILLNPSYNLVVIVREIIKYGEEDEREAACILLSNIAASIEN